MGNASATIKNAARDMGLFFPRRCELFESALHESLLEPLSLEQESLESLDDESLEHESLLDPSLSPPTVSPPQPVSSLLESEPSDELELEPPHESSLVSDA